MQSIVEIYFSDFVANYEAEEKNHYLRHCRKAEH